MAIVDVIKYEGGPDVLAWKYPNDELGTWTQVIVGETQEAVLFFNSVDTTPYRSQRQTYGQSGLMKSYMGLFMDVGKGGKNKKVTTVVQCPKCKATKQVIKGNITKCDYCDTPMETKSFSL